MFFIHFTGCSCFWKPKTKQFLTDCSNAELTSVPDNIPINTTHLLLNNNTFYHLRNNSFENLVKLEWLDASNCQIYQMEAHAFLGLQNLKILVLKDNHLNKKKFSYPQGIFSTLAENLTFLDISGNLKIKYPMSYPGEALGVLNALETLRLDCISGLKLDREFANLTNLKELDFSGGIQAHYLPDDIFSSISHLDIKTVNCTNLNVNQIGDKVFSKLKSLKVLDFNNNPFARKALLNVSFTLNQTSIEELYLENTRLGVYGEVNEFLKNLNRTNLKILSLDRNNIHRFDFSLIIFGLPLIESFTVTHNGLFNYVGLFENLINAKNLKKLDISYQHILLEATSQNLSTLQKIEPFPEVNVPEFCGYSNVCTIHWPKKLEWLATSNVNAFKIAKVPELVFLTNVSLKHADASGNMFETFPKPLYCPEKTILKVDYVDGSHCGIKCAVKDTFEHENCEVHIRFANVSHNKIGLLEGNCNKDPNDTLLVIKPLTTLEIVDLSYNSISFLFNDTFDTQINLKKLFLSHNKLSTWEPNMINSVHLEYLDLSYNYIQTFPLETRLMLSKLDTDHWQNTSKHLTLNLDGNKFLCFCNNIQFLRWLAASEIHFEHLRHCTCVFTDSTEVYISDNLNRIIMELEVECSSNIWVIFSSVALAFHIFLVTLTTVLFRFRHFLKYLILKMRMRRERLNAVMGKNTEYVFDAFISCTREGAKWAKRFMLPKLENQDTGLKFCVAQRDFLVGKTIIDNIMDTISQSRKTILMVDETFINSKWCQEELLLSHYVSADTLFHLAKQLQHEPFQDIFDTPPYSSLLVNGSFCFTGILVQRLQHDHLHFYA